MGTRRPGDQDQETRRLGLNNLLMLIPASARTISAEGSEVKTNTHGATARALRRARSPQRTHLHSATSTALRHARSPQRVRCDQDTFARRRSESASTRTISAKIRRDQDTFARRHSESASTRTISAEGSPRPRRIRAARRRERFDTHDLRTGFPEVKKIRTAPQRERFDTHVSAEGSPRSRQIRTEPQRQRFDTHGLRRGFAALKTNSHGATATALRHPRSPQRGALCKLSGLPPPEKEEEFRVEKRRYKRKVSLCFSG